MTLFYRTNAFRLLIGDPTGGPTPESRVIVIWPALDSQLTRTPVVSMDRCNACLQSTGWSLEPQSLSRALI